MFKKDAKAILDGLEAMTSDQTLAAKVCSRDCVSLRVRVHVHLCGFVFVWHGSLFVSVLATILDFWMYLCVPEDVWVSASCVLVFL